MRAIFSVVIGGQDISSALNPDTTEISITDSSGETADTASISIDDTDGYISMPKKGDTVSIALGWEGGGATVVFDGTIDDGPRSTGSRGSGRSLSISAKSADTNSKVKQPEEKHEDQKSLKDVASKWGTDAGLSEVVVHPDLASIQRDYWSMDGESFISWGRRIAQEVGATFKIMGARGVMVPRSAGVSATGEMLPPITAAWGDNLISWSISPDESRPQHKKFKVRHFDHKTAKWKHQESPAPYRGDPKAEALDLYSDPDEPTAKTKSKAKATESDRQRGNGSVEIDGNPDAQAEGTVILVGARPGIDGSYTIESATHRYSRGGGFLTSLSVKKPEAEADSRASTPA